MSIAMEQDIKRWTAKRKSAQYFLPQSQRGTHHAHKTLLRAYISVSLQH